MKITVYCAHGVVLDGDVIPADKVLAGAGSINNLRKQMNIMDTVLRNFNNMDDFTVTINGNVTYVNPSHIIAAEVDMKDVQELLDKHDGVV